MSATQEKSAQLRNAVAAGDYYGYELRAALDLHPKLPRGQEDLDDVIAWMRLYAIEAADKYDPTFVGKLGKTAKFDTYLVRHLRLRSYQWMHWAWLKKNWPSGSTIIQFSVLHAPDDEDASFDPEERLHLAKKMTDRQEQFNLRVMELFGRLSPMSQQVFKAVVADDTLIAHLSDPKRWRRISKIIGFDYTAVEAFVVEMQDKGAQCLIAC